MSIFRLSYSRGVLNELINQGLVKFASVADAQKVADEIGSSFDVEPSTGQVPAEKTASLVMSLLEKCANTGALVVGAPHQENSATNAASETKGTAALDLKNRAVGEYAQGERGVGKSSLSTAGGEVGKQEPHPKKPAVTDERGNTVNKLSSLNELIRKIAGSTGPLITGGDAKHENTPQNAAAEVGGTAAMDQKNRPQGEYAKGEKGMGNSALAAPARAGAIGKEEDQKGPHTTDHKPNSANEQSKTSAYMSRFEETATEWLPQLPKTLSENEKLAAVKFLMGAEPDEAQAFVTKLAEESGMPPELAKAKSEHEAGETKAEEKDEHKDEEKKEEEKKASETEKDAAPHRRKHVDPYGYQKYDAIAAGQKQNGPQQKKASAILSGLRGLASR